MKAKVKIKNTSNWRGTGKQADQTSKGFNLKDREVRYHFIKKKKVEGETERRVIRHTKIAVVNANKLNPLYCKNTIKFPLIMNL